jgi:hypothetical protein
VNPASPVLSRRQKPAGANHHLWNNHGTWWFHGTFHLPDYTARRIRRSLATRDLRQARALRDRILAGIDAPDPCLPPPNPGNPATLRCSLPRPSLTPRMSHPMESLAVD